MVFLRLFYPQGYIVSLWRRRRRRRAFFPWPQTSLFFLCSFSVELAYGLIATCAGHEEHVRPAPLTFGRDLTYDNQRFNLVRFFPFFFLWALIGKEGHAFSSFPLPAIYAARYDLFQNYPGPPSRTAIFFFFLPFGARNVK